MTFYDMVLDSDAIGHLFEDTDLARLVDHQTKFVASLLGGPASYSDERLAQLHVHLDISHSDFDEMIALLSAALEEHDMDQADIRQVAASIDSKRSLIVTRNAA